MKISSRKKDQNIRDIVYATSSRHAFHIENNKIIINFVRDKILDQNLYDLHTLVAFGVKDGFSQEEI